MILIAGKKKKWLGGISEGTGSLDVVDKGTGTKFPRLSPIPSSILPSNVMNFDAQHDAAYELRVVNSKSDVFLPEVIQCYSEWALETLSFVL